METLEDIYPKSFFKNRKRLHGRAEKICGVIKKVLNPRTVVDVGCGTGDLVREFNRIGIEATGIEGATTARDYLVSDKVFFHDLRTPVQPVNRSHLAICFEVAEHIEPGYANVFASNLKALSDSVLMSAAPPGQKGHYHVNCRKFGYWVNMFSDYIYVPEIVKQIKQDLESHKDVSGVWGVYKNLMYFKKRL